VDFKTSSGTFRNVNAAEMGEGRDFAPVSVLVKRWNAKGFKERLVVTAHRQKEQKSIHRTLLKCSPFSIYNLNEAFNRDLLQEAVR
jgi:hypothetical protein